MKIQNYISLAVIGLFLATPAHPSCGKFSCSTPTINGLIPFVNSDNIELPAATDVNQSGVPCPSTLQVSDIPVCHVIARLTVTLLGVTYENANLLTSVLVSPWGACSVLINNISEPANGLIDSFNDNRLEFDSCYVNNLPRKATGNEIVSGLYKPTDYKPGSYCFDNTGCIPKTLFCKASTNIFKGKSPCGTWKLFTCINPGLTEQAGVIGSWELVIETCLPCNNKWCSRPGMNGNCCVQCNPGGPCMPCKPCHPCINPCECCFKPSNCFACNTGCCSTGDAISSTGGF